MEFSIDYFTVTIWASISFVEVWLRELLQLSEPIQWERLSHGGRGFYQLWIGPHGVKLYSDPVLAGDFCCVEMPGQASSSVPFAVYVRKVGELELSGVRYNVTRLDLAFDHNYYKPADVFEAAIGGQVRSLVKRVEGSLRENKDHYGGGHTVYWGSRSSERMLRVYLKVDENGGFTRTELECKGERAHLVFQDLMGTEPDKWAGRALGHLRDFCDFFPEWWSEFCCGCERAFMKLSKPAAKSLMQAMAWLCRVAGPLLAVMEEKYGFRKVADLVDYGHDHLGQRHRLMLAA